MVQFYKRYSVLFMVTSSLYMLVCLYEMFYTIKFDKACQKRLQEIGQSPLCTAHNEILDALKSLSEDLIDIRMHVDDNKPMAKKLSKYYDTVQRLVREIESTFNQTSKPIKRRETLYNNSIHNENNNASNVVCPEKYLGTTYGYPFYTKGFETLNCSMNDPLEKLVTLIFDQVPAVIRAEKGGESLVNQSKYMNQIVNLVKNVDHHYPKVQSFFILTVTDKELAFLKRKYSRKNITFKTLYDKTRGHVIQHVISSVKTPYILLANRLTELTKEVDIERLIRVVSSNRDVIVAGGSSRNLTGHWTKNCFRLQLKNYTLQLKKGYHESLDECLVCDYIEGPFLAKTSNFKKISFDSLLNYGLYTDFFLRIKYNSLHGIRNYGDAESCCTSNGNGIVLSCPDVMFHMQKDDIKDEDLLRFSNKHTIRKIVEEDGRVRWYGCKRGISYRKRDRCTVRHGLAVAPCCLENLADAIKHVMDECGRINVICELQEGTLLGAVKLNKVLPWERDGDITFLTSDYEKLLTMKEFMLELGYLWREISSPRCCVEGRMAGGQIEILADGWSIQMYGQHRMDSEKLRNNGLQPTRVLFAGKWVNVPENPGKYVRNRYGRYIYRHAEHWISSGEESGWITYDTKGFSQCPLKGFHGCLDQYKADGSIQFENTF